MNKNIKDLTGMKFNKLTVLGISDKSNRKTYWDCMCDCGNAKAIRSDSIQSGRIKSCGCLKKEQDKSNLNRTTHNKSKSRIYNIWAGIKQRCYNVSNERYYRYGGRGITVCEEWIESFEVFHDWAVNNGYKENLTIDRIDNDGMYAPLNCKWSNDKEQCNNRETNIVIKIGNASKTLKQWCDIFELEYGTINARYNRSEDISILELFKSTIS